MSTQQVLTTAAALGEFTLDQIEVFCDSTAAEITTVLAAADGAIRRLPGDRGPDRWVVVDRGRLGDLARRPGDRTKTRRTPRPALDIPAATQLAYAEDVLLDARHGSPDDRATLVSTAQNCLRQVVSKLSSAHTAWSAVELDRADVAGEHLAGTTTATRARIRLDVAVAHLTEHELRGSAVPIPDLVGTATDLEPFLATIDRAHLGRAVGRFFDLMLAYAAPREGPVRARAPERLLLTVASRRLRGQLDVSLGNAARALVPLLTTVGRGDQESAPELYEVIEELPAGQQHVVVYRDLLAVLPEQLGWKPLSRAPSRLPGALVEAVTEPETADHLQRYADRLTADLNNTPYPSERALIGTAAYVLQDLAPNQSIDARTELLGLVDAVAHR